MDDDERAIGAGIAGDEGRAAPATGDAPRSLQRKILLLVVLAISIWHLGAIVIWMMPSSFVRDRIARATRKYTRYTKSDQFWAMFAPEPLSINRRIIVRAELQSGETREIDLTSPVNHAMRSFSFERVGKTLKAHDRLLGGDEPQYLRGFTLHTCGELSARWGEHVKGVTLFREYSVMTIDTRTFKTSRTPWERANLGTYVCVE